MSPAMKNPEPHPSEEELVAGPPPAPYTATVIGERNGARSLWWRDGVRTWIPMLAIGVTMVISIQSQMLGMQRQIGDLQGEMGNVRGEMGDLRGEMGNLRAEFRDVIRAELRTELAGLRKDMEGQIGALREDMERQIGALRADVQALGDRVQAVEERMTSLESVVETHLREHARTGSSGEGLTGRSPADRAD